MDFMIKKGLSKEDRNKFSNFVKKWFNSQNRYTIREIAEKTGISDSSCYDYFLYGKAPNNIEKANIIINFIKSHQPEVNSIEGNVQPPKKSSIPHDIKKNTEFLCQINELNNSLKQLQSSIEVIQTNLSDQNKYEEKKEKNELNYHIDNLKSSLFSLYSEIDWFKNKTNLERKSLRKSIDSKDVGYLTSMLRALMKGEEDFNDWLLVSNYQFEMLKWKKQH